jgi:hypothetical protein
MLLLNIAYPSIDMIKFGLTHGFVMQFETAEDRDYYVHKDPVHLAFSGSVGDKVDGVRVLDFEDGVF